MVRVFIVLAAVLAVAYGFTIPKPKLVDERIVGGSEIDIRQTPYQASLRRNGYHECGASIISNEWVLTAAHCAIHGGPTSWSVRVGSSYHTQGGSIHQVIDVIIHPEFNPDEGTHDFTLMQVATPFQFSDTVQAAGLADVVPDDNSRSLVSGWGRVIEGGATSLHLRAVEVYVVPTHVCSDMNHVNIDDSMICASGHEDNKGSCQGDSGGPLFSESGNLIGVVSWAWACGQAAYPTIFGNVAYARSWIRENTGV